ncbi:hypothetical protein TWF281_010714 [Arthrobotrys megalospora]
MAPILAFPTEILIQIFSNKCITNPDLSSCAQTCKLFNEVVSQVKINYTFKVDHPYRTPWKLIRTLLQKPQLGNQFQSIKVKWYRRVPRRPDTWAREWHWTNEEANKIKVICEEWDMMKKIRGQNSTLCNTILRGWDSEALIPLLLSFTSSLKSLDYGRTMLGLVTPNHSAKDGIEIALYCAGKENKVSRWFHGISLNEEAYFRKLWEIHEHNVLWLYTVLNPDKLLPGLASLRHFAHGSRVGYDGWPDSSFASIMLLPRIESMKIYNCPRLGDIGGWFRYTRGPGGRERDTGFPVGKKSSIKRLEMINCEFDLEDYKIIAECTGSLQSFSSTGCYRGDLEGIAESFLKCNKETLVEDQISITARHSSVPKSWDRDDHSYLGSDEEEEEEEEEDLSTSEDDDDYGGPGEDDYGYDYSDNDGTSDEGQRERFELQLADAS